MDHKTATIDYSTPPLTLTINYRNGNQTSVARNVAISIYKDANYSQLVTDEKRTNNSGQITMDTFVGFTGTDHIYFSCEIENRYGSTTYRGYATVEELVTNKRITLTSN